MNSNSISDYHKEIYKNWGNIKYLEKNIGNSITVASNKIKKDAARSPYLDGDIAEFIYQLLNNNQYSDEYLHEHIKIAIRYMGKGNYEGVFEVLKKKLNNDY